MATCNLDDVMRALGKLEGTVEEGFKGVHQRQDIANSKVAAHEERIQRLEISNATEDGKRSAFSWVGNFVVGGVGIVMGFLGSWIQSRGH